MASKLLVLGARPFGMTPGGGWRALFITLLQLATMVRMVSDSSWDTLLQQWETSQSQKAGLHSEPDALDYGQIGARLHQAQRDLSPGTGLQAGQHGGQGLGGQLGAFGLVLVGGKTSHDRRTAPLQECYAGLDERFLRGRNSFQVESFKTPTFVGNVNTYSVFSDFVC